ncbi:MAG: hypothetical protein JNK65_03090, partial [Deltaproteobacteria bacterium]|nr:hypothetical protein [Deltaproteobacteria bacterium]
ASTLPDLIPLLDQRWLERWKRSQNPYPCDLLLEGEKEIWSQKIESHPQFSKK